MQLMQIEWRMNEMDMHLDVDIEENGCGITLFCGWTWEGDFQWRCDW
jgi:hypothetical protein